MKLIPTPIATNEILKFTDEQLNYRVPMQTVTEELIRLEEKVLKGALLLHLKREPVIEDFKKCSVLRNDNFDMQYLFAYENETIGLVTFVNEISITEPNHKIKVTFQYGVHSFRNPASF